MSYIVCRTCGKWISASDLGHACGGPEKKSEFTPKEKAQKAYEQTLRMREINQKLREMGIGLSGKSTPNSEDNNCCENGNFGDGHECQKQPNCENIDYFSQECPDEAAHHEYRAGFNAGFGKAWEKCPNEEWECRRVENKLRVELEQANDIIARYQENFAKQTTALAKSNSERDQLLLEAAEWERVANEWMRDYDKLKEKYEPKITILSNSSGSEAKAHIDNLKKERDEANTELKKIEAKAEYWLNSLESMQSKTVELIEQKNFFQEQSKNFREVMEKCLPGLETAQKYMNEHYADVNCDASVDHHEPECCVAQELTNAVFRIRAVLTENAKNYE